VILELRLKMSGVLDHDTMPTEFFREALLGLGFVQEHGDTSFAAGFTFGDALHAVNFVESGFRFLEGFFKLHRGSYCRPVVATGWSGPTRPPWLDQTQLSTVP